MKFSLSTVAAVAALVPSISAHYCFNKLIVDGAVVDAEPYEYVRKNTNSNSPVTDVTSDEIICNAGGLASGATTKTKEVAPGSQVGFALDTAIGHPGPLQVYLSQVKTGEVTAAKGDDGWFKVYEMGIKEITDDGLQWASDGITNFTFPLPEDTPAGDYLMRVEHIGLHGAGTEAGAQFYISCAQLTVTGSGAGSPSPKVAFPGAYKATDPGLLINIYWPIPTDYTMPGPSVWPEGSGSSSGSSNSSAAAPVASTPAASTPTTVAAAAVVSTPAAISTPAVVPTPVGTPVGTPLFTPPANTPVSTPSAGGAVKKFGQCGGSNYKGSTECESGSTCKQWNDFYSQCV
ncbi:Cellulose-binding domain fungal [Macrophomina phaseolina MS6]|uniref:lytic cellulose monooxygenase (C4-dehydrogenating) n=2 Tax=Macrophomina phaseolina TaxID=35725 RepID=K2SR24_MACPH|nr:Cellulose-binding domain fungal [Macrophomina phaseolina MS6]KAH7054483.1 glycosyl hydrolase family 61-domain-containing protein [Macrophomina phaseolina]